MKNRKALVYGVLAALFAAVFATLFLSALWQQFQNPNLMENTRRTAEIFAKYAVAFFFLGLAKWKMHKLKDMHARK